MSFFEDMFEGLRRREHGHHGDHGYGRHHGHDDDHHDHDRYDGDRHRPGMGAPYAPPPLPGAASAACPKCNAVVVLQPGTRFCGSCGGPLAANPSCVRCGATLVQGAAFCQGCGAPA